MSVISMNSIFGFMSKFSFLLKETALIFKSMPNLEISPNLDVSSLIEQAGKTTEAGTILQSNGSPVAVILGAAQYKSLHNIIDASPSIIQDLQDKLKTKEKFYQTHVEGLGKIGSGLHSMPLLILIGTVVTFTGAFFLGKSYNEVEDDNQKFRMSHIIPRVMIIAGISALAFSFYGVSSASRDCLDLANKMGLR
jgi:hypothetical protein